MAIAISDSSSSIRVSMPRVYRDLPMSFQKHPGTGDVRPIEDLAAVKQSVKNLIFSIYYFLIPLTFYLLFLVFHIYLLLFHIL